MFIGYLYIYLYIARVLIHVIIANHYGFKTDSKYCNAGYMTA